MMTFQILSILLVITSGVLCSGTQQGVSSTQAGQTLQIQTNVRKYNKHTATEKPCTTGSTTGSRKDKPESATDAQDYVAIGGAASPGYPYPYPYPYTTYPVQVVPGGRPVQQYYPYEPQYPVETAPPSPYYAPYYHASPTPPPYYPASPSPSYYPASPSPSPSYYPASPSSLPPYYPAPTTSYAAYPTPSQQQLYEQSTVVDAYRSPPAYLQQADGQSPSQQYYRQPGTTPYYYPPSHFRTHAYNRPAAVAPPAFLQQRDAASNVEQYEQQQSAGTSGGSIDAGNQFHH